jgi:AcrR family transcriptional regulator
MDTRERILSRAHELFHRYGLRSVSMDDIATEAGMSKKTLYQYFTDKEELVNAVFTRVMEENRGTCTLTHGKAENAIQEVFLLFDSMQDMFNTMNPVVLYDMQKYHPATFKKFQEFKNGFIYGMIRTNLEQGIREGLYRDDIDVDIISRYRLYSIMLSFNSDIFPANKTNLLHIERQLIEHFLYGLSTPKGQKLIQKYKQQRHKHKIA